jgi:hypothetical protein
MNQLGLLALGRSFAGGRKKARSFRVDPGALPRFNVASASAAAPPKAAPSGAPAQSPFSGARTVDERPRPSGTRSRPDDRSPSFPSLPSGATQPGPAPARAPGAGEPFSPNGKPPRADAAGTPPALHAVRVARNDFRDTDLEVVTPAPGKGRQPRRAATLWRQWVGAWFRMGR